MISNSWKLLTFVYLAIYFEFKILNSPIECRVSTALRFSFPRLSTVLSSVAKPSHFSFISFLSAISWSINAWWRATVSSYCFLCISVLCLFSLSIWFIFSEVTRLLCSNPDFRIVIVLLSFSSSREKDKDYFFNYIQMLSLL